VCLCVGEDRYSITAYFWFLQEQIKDIIIIGPTKAVTYPAVLVNIQHPTVADAHPVVSAQNQLRTWEDARP